MLTTTLNINIIEPSNKQTQLIGNYIMKNEYTANKHLSVNHAKQDAIRAKNRQGIKPTNFINLSGFIKFMVFITVICLIKSIIF